MDDRRLALLRGVNVGSAKRVAMVDVPKLVDALGYGDVRTLLNSGHLGPDPSLTLRLADALNNCTL